MASCGDQIFDHVVKLNRNRIHGRLESESWQIPAYLHRRTGNYERQPLYREMEKHTSHLARPGVAADLTLDIKDLCTWYRRADTLKTDEIEEVQVLKQITQRSHMFSALLRSKLRHNDTLRGLNAKGILQSKHFLQVEKLGRYWGLCVDMAQASCKYRALFSNVQLDTLNPYESIKSAISYNGNVVECFVHAEMQLLVYYGLHHDPNILQPRVFGVSKSACYLCNHFILYHEQFFLSKTHGKLYDQWNIPDLCLYNEVERTKYRRVLSQISNEVLAILPRERSRYQKRRWPLESRIHLPDSFLTSPPSSDAATQLTEASGTAGDATTGVLFPRAPHRTPTSNPTPPMIGPSFWENSVSLPEKTNSPRPLASTTSSAATQQYHTSSAHVTEGRESPSVSSHEAETFAAMTPSDPSPRISRMEPDRRGNDALHAPSRAPFSAPSESHKFPNPSNQSPPPQTTIKPRPRPSRSSSTLTLSELPVQKIISSLTPFRTRSGGISITFEIESPAHGIVAITPSAYGNTPLSGFAVDIEAMKDGESCTVDRKDGEDSISLNLRHSNGRSTNIVMQWL